MNTFTPELLTKKIDDLRLTIPKLAKLLNLSVDNLYKWTKGHRPANYNDNIKLENFTNGMFDKFVINGKLVEGYDFDLAMQQIFPRNPTNDFFENQVYSNILQEPSIPYGKDPIALNKIIQMQEEKIMSLRAELQECLQSRPNQKIA